MRITAEAKQRTRQRILEEAGQLFAERGFSATTTRELAAAADIAVGTLFNYFAGKEALGLAILSETVAAAHASFRDAIAPADERLEEALFRLIIEEIRCLEPCRPFVAELLDAIGTVTFAAGVTGADDAPTFPMAHLDLVAVLLRQRQIAAMDAPATVHLYLTLYLGMLTFWSADTSPGQAQTLAMLDQSTRLLARMLESQESKTEVDHVPDHR